MSILEAYLAEEAPSPAAIFVPPSSQKLHRLLYLRPIVFLEPDALGFFVEAGSSSTSPPPQADMVVAFSFSLVTTVVYTALSWIQWCTA